MSEHPIPPLPRLPRRARVIAWKALAFPAPGAFLSRVPYCSVDEEMFSRQVALERNRK